MKQGVLIAFEGIDGTGKSTQIHLLADYLRAKGFEVVVTREPTDGPYGRRIRHLYVNRQSSTPEEELELFVQDRRQHVDEVIAPALAEGKIVLTDRYYYSTAAYQGAAGMDPEAIFAANDFAPRPDLVVLLVMDPEESVRRIEQLRGERLNDFEQIEQLRKVADLFATFSDDCILRVDAARPIDRVQAEIQKGIQPLVEHDHRKKT
ncbi:MAG: dTMP kinase [Desulfobulbus sp.]|nr:MAG: dTMP kinase [Desulfobulbus sp.]